MRLQGRIVNMKYEREAGRAVRRERGTGDGRGWRAKGQEKGESPLEPGSGGNAAETRSALCELRWKFLGVAGRGRWRGLEDKHLRLP